MIEATIYIGRSSSALEWILASSQARPLIVSR